MVNDSMKTIAWAADNFTCSVCLFYIAIPSFSIAIPSFNIAIPSFKEGIAIEKAYKKMYTRTLI